MKMDLEVQGYKKYENENIKTDASLVSPTLRVVGLGQPELTPVERALAGASHKPSHPSLKQEALQRLVAHTQ